jgi:hypothetical protein
MITKEDALKLKYRDELHFGECRKKVSPRGGVKITNTIVRVNGKVKTWKQNLSRFEVPIKHGLYDHSYVDERNAHDFHLPKDCPLLKE